jgi:pyroglutamyl-peptidase
MKPPCFLLTGFEPFDGASSNPSWQLAEALHGQTVSGASIQSVQLPCVFGFALETLAAALETYQPRWVLALGLAAGRTDMSLERVAINVDDARIPDNHGHSPIDIPVVAGGPAAFFSTLPIKTIVEHMQAAGVPAAVSQTAGTFVCNHVFYGLMHTLRRRRRVRAGFMHVPLLADQADSSYQPGLDWTTQLRGLRVAVQTIIETSQDAPLPGGAVS